MPKSSLRPWILFAPAALFYLYEYVLRVSPSVMTHQLMRDFGVQSSALGMLVSFYYYSYVPLQVPCGVITDWLGPRIVVTFSALLCSVGSLMFAYSDHFITAEVARFLLGIGSACAYICCTKVGADWFSAEKFAVIAGLTQMMGTVGGILGGKPFAMLVNSMGWREAMIIASYTGILVMLIAWVIIRSPEKRSLASNQQGIQPTKEKYDLLKGLKIIVKNPQSWVIGFYGCLMYVPISAFAELWGVPYLMKSHGISNEEASLASAMVFFGMALGAPLGATLSNKIRSRVKVMSWSAISTLILFCFSIYIPGLSLYPTYILLFLSGLACGGQILYFAAAKEINPQEYSATTIGVTNALVMVNGIVSQPLLGFIIDKTWDGVLNEDGTPFYSVNDYKQALVVIPSCLVVAWILTRFIKESYPAHSKKD